MSKRAKKDQWIDVVVFGVLLVLVSAVTLNLFHHQTTGNPGYFHSDMKAYILEMQGLDSGYSFPYPIFFKVGAFFHLFMNPELAVAVATMVLNSLAMVVVKLAMNRLALGELSECFPRAGYLAGIIISVASLSLFFISMLFPPKGIYLPGIKYIYLGVFTGNPFHNATYMAARPFMILAFLWYVKLLDRYERLDLEVWKKNWSDYAWFALFLLLATMTKPSFTIVLVGTAGLIMVYRMICSRFQNFWPTIVLGCCFLPTFADLLYQYSGVFVPKEGEEGGIGFCLGEVWSLYCDNIPLAVCLAVGFPLLVLLLHFKELRRDTLFRFSWQVFLCGFAMAFFLYEKGFRQPDFNFSWGYMCGIFIVQFSSLLLLLKSTGSWHTQKSSEKAFMMLQWMAYGAHMLCGLAYFLDIYRGAMYY